MEEREVLAFPKTIRDSSALYENGFDPRYTHLLLNIRTIDSRINRFDTDFMIFYGDAGSTKGQAREKSP
ncbi:MAG: hypothetical protein QHI48_11080 [Bacteroidota bacterium]|nr:hypothetical protein [Bacteroidota bacterium]